MRDACRRHVRRGPLQGRTRYSNARSSMSVACGGTIGGWLGQQHEPQANERTATACSSSLPPARATRARSPPPLHPSCRAPEIRDSVSQITGSSHPVGCKTGQHTTKRGCRPAALNTSSGKASKAQQSTVRHDRNVRTERRITKSHLKESRLCQELELARLFPPALRTHRHHHPPPPTSGLAGIGLGQRVEEH
eukprot:scaffold12393_cov105-Isochrysis_galbana.AAC.7